jgi:hypothetical protein
MAVTFAEYVSRLNGHSSGKHARAAGNAQYRSSAEKAGWLFFCDHEAGAEHDTRPVA